MLVREVKHVARSWVESSRDEWSGLVAAHLVGGITAMGDDTEYPSTKDVDIHLIFADDSPMLIPSGPFGNIIGVEWNGILVEAGLKPISDYASTEKVLANPEIAQHLLYDSVLFDPDNLVGNLRADVDARFNQRRWVRARVAHERNGLEEAVAMTPFVREQFGASGELNVLGYSTTFLTAALQLAALKPLKMGGRMFVNLREVLAEYDRLDLYEELLIMLGTDQVTVEQAQEFLNLGADAFDLAITVRKSRFPFDHKLHAHLRPYFVDSCQQMIDEGNHREAFCWIAPFYLCSSDVLIVDGNPEQQAKFGERQRQFLDFVGFVTEQQRASKQELAAGVRSQVFALVDQIIATNPDVAEDKSENSTA